MKRYIILVCAVAMQMCLGATYSWSVYVKALKQLTGLSQGWVQLPFSVFYFVFPATVMVSGSFLLPKFGPRRCAAIGGLIFGAGWLTASLGTSHFALTVLGIGLLGGIGAGLAYLVPITVCIQWFPKHKGLVAGIAVAGFGGGAALVSMLGGRLINDGLVTPFATFGYFGCAFLVVAAGAGLLMQAPPDVAEARVERLTPSKVIGRRAFRILYAAMFTGLAAGFVVNANLKEFYAGNNVKAGVLAVSLFAVANALGRIGWGLVFDRVRSSVAVQLNLASQALTVLLAFWALHSAAGLLTFAFLAGLNYGGVLVVYVSTVSRVWGRERVGEVYGLLFSANIVAAAFPVMAGLCYDRLGNFNAVMCALSVLLIAAMVLVRRTETELDGENKDNHGEHGGHRDRADA